MDSRVSPYFLVAATLCAFCITTEYSITRPVSNAIFLSHFSSSWIPYAWLVSVPLNLTLVTLYNFLLPRWGTYKLFLSTAFLVIGMNFLCGLYAQKIPYLSFFHYVWKDIYILLMFKQLWSLIHTTVDTTKNRYIYSFLFGVGGFGSILGSMFPSFLAVRIGSNMLFFFALPIYLFLMISYWATYKRSYITQPSTFSSSSWKGFSLIGKSRYLACLLGIVIFMQMSVALTDFQFNTLLEKAMPTVDLKAQYYGETMALVNSIAIFFQLVGTAILIKVLGVRFSHMIVPLALGCNAFLFLLFPTFGIVSYSFITIKIFDFSLFTMIREMLYSPLQKEEKFHAKSVIDVFAYRSAKALSSLVIIAVPFALKQYLLSISSFFLMAIFCFWLFTLFYLFKQEKAKVLL